MEKTRKSYFALKRLIDLIGALLGIIISSVFLWWWIIAINFISTKGHPFFNQLRVGRNGKPFILLKFRSMDSDASEMETSQNVEVKEHITRFGKFLRNSSLDETLQLFNIFVGQMSFIGPRPLIDKEVDSLTIQLRKENGSIKLRPGLSGYAQLNNREMLDPVKKAEFDLYYYQHISFWFDIKLFVMSLFEPLIKKKGQKND